MAGRFVAVVGAVALALAATGLALDAVRPGPLDVALHAATVPAQADGSYLATAATPGPLGVCVAEPCAARTRVDLRVQGLPPLAYTARLEGPSGAEDLGAFSMQGATHTLAVDRAEDHTDKQRLVLLFAGLPLHAWAVGPGERSLAGPFQAGLALPPMRMRLDEIGAVTVSTTATARLPAVVPEGFEAVVRLGPGSGTVELGRFEPGEAGDGGLVLDGRKERVRLADHGRVVVVLQAGDDPAMAFPAWQGTY